MYSAFHRLNAQKFLQDMHIITLLDQLTRYAHLHSKNVAKITLVEAMQLLLINA